MTARELPRRGQWVALTLGDGRTIVCRFVTAAGRMKGVPRWYVDHGAHGTSRDDHYMRSDFVASWVAAECPALRLSYVDPYGKRRFVGRYATQADAETAATPWRQLVRDVCIEAAA